MIWNIFHNQETLEDILKTFQVVVTQGLSFSSRNKGEKKVLMNLSRPYIFVACLL